MATTLELSESEATTILTCLAWAGTPSSLDTIVELKRQGVRIPTWIQENVTEAWYEADCPPQFSVRVTLADRLAPYTLSV